MLVGKDSPRDGGDGIPVKGAKQDDVVLAKLVMVDKNGNLYVKDKQMMTDLLRFYASTRDLFASKKNINLAKDASGLGGVISTDSNNQTITLDNLVRVVENNFSKRCHRQVTQDIVFKDREPEIKYREGKAPSIQIRTEKRMNHNCTLIHGLPKYSYDNEKVAEFLKQKFGGNSYVDGTEIILQGFFDQSVSDLLVGTLMIPEDAIENHAENRKKDMKEKTNKGGRLNVVKA